MENRIRYTVDKVVNNYYYQMPKFLFSEEFKSLSNDARVLYTLLKDRHELSVKNAWYNEKKEVYLIMRREEMETMLNLSAPTIRKALKELKTLNLIEEERQGLNKPNLLYLLECKNFSLQSVRKFHSKAKENYSPKCKNFSPNHNNHNQTNPTCENNSINQTSSDTIDRNSIKEAVKNKIFLEHLQRKYPDKQRELQELYDIIIEVLVSRKKSFRIAKEDMPAETVKQAFFALDYSHVEYVLECLSKNTTKVKSTKAYLQTALFNASKTINNYYSMSMQNSMYERFGIEL